jgi:hypothetical protein
MPALPARLAVPLLLSAVSLRAAVDFNRDVRPLISDRCFACHGPDDNKREAGLRLDTFDGATATLKSGARAIVPGKPEESELLQRIHTTDPDDLMPPAKLNRPLTDSDRAMLRQWIAEGAGYTKHWAYVPVKAHTPPPVQQTAWPRDDLDRFVLAKLEQEQLSPAPEAERAAWLRRTSFVLTGLPPSPEQIDSFLADAAPDAFEKQVDALLASPRYGERMALDWLDVARFADTYGYQSDNNCFVWPWRDWVIRAFNDNLAYDKFLTWQIAGDLLPNATREQKLATMFNRLHRQTQEGGSIEEEFRQEYVSDRVHTTGTAFLGLTMECAKCHDHKYDPLPMTDYYSLCAMFGSIDECGLYPYSLSTTAPEPSMPLADSQQEQEIGKRRAALQAAVASSKRTAAGREEAFRVWLAATASLAPPAPSDHFPLNAVVDGKLPNAVAKAAPGTMSGGQLVPADGGVKFDGDTVLQLDGVKGITRHQPLTVSVRLFSPERKQRALLLHTGPAMFSQMADASGFELIMENGKLRWSCIHLWPGCAASVETAEDFPVGKLVQVTVTYDGSSTAEGLRIYYDGQPVIAPVQHDTLDKSISTDVMRVGARPRDDRGFADGLMKDLKVFRAALSPLEVAELHAPTLAATLAKAKSGDDAALALVREHYLRRVDAETAKARDAVTAARRHLEDDYEHHIPLVMVMKDSPRPRPWHVLARGDYASPDFKRPVQPGAPSAVMPFAENAPKNRLGLAQWMTHRDNPLVPRVAVNRLWMQCFGAGIVPTQENFGMQGDPPSHQELLDTLAHDFMQQGWDVKRMLRRMVLSATFRQSSVTTKEKRERDPKNQWLSRGPSSRLSGEAIRDQALLAAGLLVEKIGGPSVKPWQPPGVWSEAGASGGDYQPDKGEGLYRRSLYTFRKRTAPPPAMLTLDAGSREICQPRRLTTNTPLQPLIFLNDQSFFECARKLAERVLREQPEGADAQMRRAFLLLASRLPDAVELAAISALYENKVKHFTGDLAAAKAVCGKEDARLAALTIVCSTLLASDAALTIR